MLGAKERKAVLLYPQNPKALKIDLHEAELSLF
jgi:hypothetical protein